jgi:hypothetical protein
MIFVAPQHYLPGSLEAHHNVRRLVNLLDNYRLISSQIIGLADKSFPHNPEHAQALRGFHYAISTAFGLFSRSDTARCKVLLGIGTL